MLLGTDIEAVLAIAEGLEVDIVGLNCSTGPEDMRDAIRYLGEHSPLPVHCIPNAGLPLQGPDGETIFPETPEQLSSGARRVRRESRRRHRRRLLRDDPDAHRGDRRARRATTSRASGRPPGRSGWPR